MARPPRLNGPWTMLRAVFLLTCIFGRNADRAIDVSWSHSFWEVDSTGSWNRSLGKRCWI